MVESGTRMQKEWREQFERPEIFSVKALTSVLMKLDHMFRERY